MKPNGVKRVRTQEERGGETMREGGSWTTPKVKGSFCLSVSLSHVEAGCT